MKKVKKHGKDSRMVASLVIIAVSVVSLAIFYQRWTADENTTTTAAGVELIIYRTELCPCCEDYETYLRSNGVSFHTVLVGHNELEEIKIRLGISKELYSCHTIQAGSYFVEGHVPIEAITKLLNERPAIDGIAVPGMPSGSPGMGGIKTEPLKIYAKAGEKITIWMTL